MEGPAIEQYIRATQQISVLSFAPSLITWLSHILFYFSKGEWEGMIHLEKAMW